MSDNSEIIDALEELGHAPFAYSGRSMHGKQCAAIELEGDGDLWELAYQLGVRGIDIGKPSTDSLGKNMVAYWRSAKWEA